jgi:hypothetical protein
VAGQGKFWLRGLARTFFPDQASRWEKLSIMINMRNFFIFSDFKKKNIFSSCHLGIKLFVVVVVVRLGNFISVKK